MIFKPALKAGFLLSAFFVDKDIFYSEYLTFHEKPCYTIIIHAVPFIRVVCVVFRILGAAWINPLSAWFWIHEKMCLG